MTLQPPSTPTQKEEIEEMSPQKKTTPWDDVKQRALDEMEKKHKVTLEKAVNFLGGYFDTREPMLDEHNNKEFSDFGFDAYTLYYRKPEKYWNEVGLLVPKGIDASKREGAPIHVFFPGGGFWTGDWKWCPWYLQEFLREAKDQGAVILAVNYPRFPLADIKDITRAVDDFWNYFYSSELIEDYKNCVRSLALDKTKLLISGESAGGYAAAYSVMRPHEELNANVLFLRYPMLRHYKRADREKEQLPYMQRKVDKNDVKDKVVELGKKVQMIRKEMKERKLLDLSDEGIFADILDRRTPPYGMCGAFASSWCDTWTDYFGNATDGGLLPDILTQMENGKKAPSDLKKVPALFIYHGDADTNVPLEVSETFVEQWKRLFKQDNLKGEFKKRDEGAHGFDYWLDDKWMRDFVENMTKAWISG
ncbi:hypothetical protein SLS60_006931 [Paraconiothyrium brasiliense]|uniref:Alpha/beta hydrolase fold-3 domain-containing protein n=1 Tax=Paraconiothyrium brasiliense TaxID=300254 RepID=A0ABR3R7Y8_9PLEO